MDQFRRIKGTREQSRAGVVVRSRLVKIVAPEKKEKGGLFQNTCDVPFIHGYRFHTRLFYRSTCGTVNLLPGDGALPIAHRPACTINIKIA